MAMASRLSSSRRTCPQRWRTTTSLVTTTSSEIASDLAPRHASPPQPVPADEGIRVPTGAHARGESVQQLRVAAADDNIPDLERRPQPRQNIDDRSSPFLLAQPFQPGLADVSLIRATVLVGQVGQFHGLEDAVDDLRRDLRLVAGRVGALVREARHGSRINRARGDRT